ncbi:MAG: hypothetical protein IJ597_05995, partial [Synergistaceae bacterium]|nr:hypothetical protein [Synergistaceae bacterium]
MSSVSDNDYSVKVAVSTDTIGKISKKTVPLQVIPAYIETETTDEEEQTEGNTDVTEAEEGTSELKIISILPEDIVLPSWLSVDQVHTIEVEDITYIDSFDIKLNSNATSIKGEKATIRFPIKEVIVNSSDSTISVNDSPNMVIQWEVTCNLDNSLEPETLVDPGGENYSGGDDDDDNKDTPKEADARPFGLAGESEVSFELTPGVSQNKTATYKGRLPVTRHEINRGTLDSKITLNVDYTKFDFKKDTEQTGTITLTANVPSSYTSSNNNPYFQGSVTFYNQYNASFDVSVDVTIKTDAAFSLSFAPSSGLTLSAGETKNVTVTASGVSSGLTWAYNANGSGLTISQSSSTGNSVTYAISAPASVKAGDYRILVTGTYNGKQNSVYVPVTVQSSSGGEDSTAFNLSATPKYVNAVIGGNAKTVTITANGANIKSWKQSSENSGLNVTVTGSGNSATVSIAASASATAGTQTVKITATDSNGNSKTIDITVIVSATELSEYEEYAFIIEANSQNIIDAYKSQNENVTSDTAVEALNIEDFDEDTAGTSDFTTYLGKLNPAEVPVIPLRGIPNELIEDSKLYVFPISFDLVKSAIEDSKLIVGEKFMLHLFSMSLDDDGNVTDTISDDLVGIFVDDSGKQITTVPEPSDSISRINAAVYIAENGEVIDYWPVISKYKIAIVSSDRESVTLAPGGTTTLKFAANKNVTSWDVSAPDGILTSVQNSKNETTEVLITVLPTASLGDYKVTVTASDIDKTKVSKDIALKVADSSQVLALTADRTSVSLTSGGTAQNVTITASGNNNN